MPSPSISLTTADLVKALEPFTKQFPPDVRSPLWMWRDQLEELARIASALPAYVLAPREALEQIADLDKFGGYNSACHMARAMLAAAEGSDHG